MKIKELIKILEGEDQEMPIRVWSEDEIEFVEAVKEDVHICELCGCDEEPAIGHYLVIDIGRKQ